MTRPRVLRPARHTLSSVLNCCTVVACLASTALAAVPADLSNFQNEYVCDANTLIVRPQTVQDVQTAVANYAYVRSNGKGHSWNRPFFCANTSAADSNGTAVNIQLSTLRPLGITVLEDEQAAWVDAGIMTIQLIDYLADYVTAKAPAGYTLGAFPWYVYQSVAGAIATGTHGSSLTYNSLSHQVLALDLVLANGTLVTLSPETHPFLMRAARVSVGRLGVITRVKFRIVKEQPVKRELRQMSVTQFLNFLQTAQNYYKANGVLPPELNETEWFWQTQRSQIYMVSFTRADTLAAAGNTSEVQSLLSQWQPDATTTYDTSREWLQKASRLEDLPIKSGVTYTSTGVTQTAAQSLQAMLSNSINTPLPAFLNSSDSVVASATPSSKRLWRQPLANQGENASVDRPDRTQGVPWPQPTPRAVNVLYGQPGSAVPLMDANRAGIMVIARNATIEASRAYLYQPQALETQIKGVLYDQYEMSVPVSSMYECVKGMMELMYGTDLDSAQPSSVMTDKGFRSAPLMRLVGKEDGLLAQTEDGPRLFFNIEDYLYYNGGRKGPNQAFKKVVGYLRSSPACGSAGLTGAGGRLHWGKAGWPDAGCWRGDVEYPGTWCDFGCAVKALDPTDKFVGSAPDRWNWNGVDLDRCCGPDGFDKSQPGCVCTVNHARAANTCPPPPYYTYR